MPVLQRNAADNGKIIKIAIESLVSKQGLNGALSILDLKFPC